MAKKTIQALLLVNTVLLASLLLVGKASAAVRCETQYGGAQVCVRTGALQVNKQVKQVTGKGGEHEWKDYLGVQSGVRFKPGNEIEFRIQVKNTGDAKFDTVNFNDTLPYFLELSSGNLNVQLKNLEPGQTQEVFIKGRVVGADRLTKAADCGVNTAEAKGKDTSGQESSDRDSVEVCFEKAIGQPTGLPKAGPEDLYLLLILSTIAAGSGLYLFRKAERI